MPNASQRYSADTMNSNCAALGDAAFVGFSRTLNGQTPSRESQYRMPDPMLPTGYTYKLNGALDEETYPSGRVVKNVLDNTGDLSIVQSKKNTASGYWHFADSFTYNAAGAVTSMQLGNGRWESTQFNSRLQPTQIALGSTNAATDLVKLNYTYNTTGNADNNGNVLSQTITVPTVGSNNGFVAVQSYGYDELNRLKDATEIVTPTGGSSSQSWKQEFSFDRYGNRSFVTGTGHTDTLGSCTTMCNPTFDATNNRITSSGFSYDSSGNTTRDAADRKFTYDAENKQTKAETLSAGTNTVTGTIGEYSYDGDGRRVKKYVPSTGETTIFVYDAAGKQIAEYSTVVASANDAKVAYLTADHLGSPRINTDATGSVTARHDYHPFGEEIDGTGGRTTGLNYGSDTVRKQFTGYERDGETGSDFAEARYYSAALGRFSSVDPVGVNLSRKIDPQRINAYVFVRDNPLKFVDTDGRDLTLAAGLKKSEQDRIIKNAIKLYRKESGRKALERMENSGTTYEFRVGRLPNKSSDVGVAENYGLTKPDTLYGKKDEKTGKIISIDKDKITVGITLDLNKLDQTQRDILDGKRSVGTLPSESEVFDHEIGHGDDFENDPVNQQNQSLSQDEENANNFVQRIRMEKDTMSEEDARARVREILGLPPEPSKRSKKQKERQ